MTRSVPKPSDSTSQLCTDCARFKLSAMLYSSDPSVSVCPSMMNFDSWLRLINKPSFIMLRRAAS